MKYKLENYQKNFLYFVCGNPTSTKALGQDEETETGPNGTVKKEEVQIEEPHDLRSGTTKEEEI